MVCKSGLPRKVRGTHLAGFRSDFIEDPVNVDRLFPPDGDGHLGPPRLYFAYGSNMSATQMRSRCPQSEQVGAACLPHHRWIITERGFASVVPHPDSVVHGNLWALSATDEVALDQFEDVTRGDYEKHRREVRTDRGPREALVYIDPRSEPGEATIEYRRRINRAVIEAHLPLDYVESQIRPWIRAD